METEKGTVPPPEAPPTAVATTMDKKCRGIDVILRVLLLAASIVAIVVMVTSKQTATVLTPRGPIRAPAKFEHSPAFIYFVVALSVAGLYSIITAIASLSFFRKSSIPPKLFWILLVHDVLILGIVAAATGAAGGVGYIGLKGNTHVKWMKICNFYGKFCRHIGGSIFVSLFAAVVLVLLVVVNGYSLYCRIPE
ncbi:CASP-like protein Ni6 [Chenopodium quinoa]|uniref:CASP-like protein Ni6 n=1 Tax=Chenopodium quinoa TaxID=63459 RepID=UPI000B78C642|nr:CASP-like protein Ni6 [Chenopodium quinoa]